VAADRSKPRGNVREGGRAVPDEVVGLSSERQLSESARPGRTGRAEWGPPRRALLRIARSTCGRKWPELWSVSPPSSVLTL
jgi:hypothetical protein